MINFLGNLWFLTEIGPGRLFLKVGVGSDNFFFQNSLPGVVQPAADTTRLPTGRATNRAKNCFPQNFFAAQNFYVL